MTFEEFAAARLPAVLRFAAVLTGDHGLAEDVVQEVLIRANGRWEPALLPEALSSLPGAEWQPGLGERRAGCATVEGRRLRDRARPGYDRVAGGGSRSGRPDRRRGIGARALAP